MLRAHSDREFGMHGLENPLGMGASVSGAARGGIPFTSGALVVIAVEARLDTTMSSKQELPVPAAFPK